MTAPTSTAVTVTENASLGNLPAYARQQLELRKLSNQVAGELAKMNWGEKLDTGTRRAVADWGQKYNVDVTTEIDVLGNRIYMNGRYYLRRLAGLVEAGLVEYAYADHVAEDARLAKLGTEGEAEISRRLRERIKHKIPDNTTAAVIFRIKLHNVREEFTGAKWTGGGGKKPDPVGDAYPVETAETRAARRCLRQLVGHVPKVIQEIQEIETSAEILSGKIEQSKQAFREVEAANRFEPKALNAPVSDDDPYDARDVVGVANEPDHSTRPFPEDLGLDDRKATRSTNALRDEG